MTDLKLTSFGDLEWRKIKFSVDFVHNINAIVQFHEIYNLSHISSIYLGSLNTYHDEIA